MLQFIQIYIGARLPITAPLTEEQWTNILLEAGRQKLQGILYQVILKMPQALIPPKNIKIRIAISAEAIAKLNARLDRQCEEITQQMSSLGLKCCVLKGQSYAHRYPYPLSRACGDIDIWVKGNLKDTLSSLRKKWKTGDVFYHHTEIRPFDDRTIVEVHFKPSWMNCPITDRKLQKYFDEQVDRQVGHTVNGLEFPVTDTEFDCVFCAVHIYRHMLLEGVGMRQVMDYYYILLQSSYQERSKAAEVLSSLKMKRFIGALMFTLHEWFMLDEKYFILPADEKYGRFLMNEIKLAGNFGQFDARYHIKGSDSMPVRAIKKMSRLWKFMSISPSEVLWAPIFKAWQHLWRKTICQH